MVSPVIRKTLHIGLYDSFSDTIVIEGIRYSGELFRFFGFGKEGSLFRLGKHNGDTRVIELVEEKSE